MAKLSERKLEKSTDEEHGGGVATDHLSSDFVKLELGESSETPPSLRRYSGTDKPAPVFLSVDRNCIPFRDALGDNRVVTVTLNGPRMEYDAGAGVVASNQFTLTRNVGRFDVDPVKVRFRGEDALDSLAITVKIKACN